MSRLPRQAHASALRHGRISEAFACYSITKVVEQRKNLLACEDAARILLDSWQYLRVKNRIKLFAFCIMPDHYHIAFCLMPGEQLSKLMEDSSKFTARQLNKLFRSHGRFWQNGFHDRNCRDEDELHDLCLYIEHNPVRRGLVNAAVQWPYSSAYAANGQMLDRDWWP